MYAGIDTSMSASKPERTSPAESEQCPSGFPKPPESKAWAIAHIFSLALPPVCRDERSLVSTQPCSSSQYQARTCCCCFCFVSPPLSVVVYAQSTKPPSLLAWRIIVSRISASFSVYMRIIGALGAAATVRASRCCWFARQRCATSTSLRRRRAARAASSLSASVSLSADTPRRAPASDDRSSA